MTNYREFVAAFRGLGLGDHARVIVHASLSAFGVVPGGAEAVVGAMLASFETIVVPTFTYKTMVTPPSGPGDNALRYGSNADHNLGAAIFHDDMPADPSMGRIAETLRRLSSSRRSQHPILSFSGVNASLVLESQSLQEPLAPIGCLAADDGDVLLLGVDQSANTSIHYAEMLAGRKQFVRWALTRDGVVNCPSFPGCSEGFNAIAPRLSGLVRRTQLGPTKVEAIPIRDLIHIAVGWIREDPSALLCERADCLRCQAVRASSEPAS